MSENSLLFDFFGQKVLIGGVMCNKCNTRTKEWIKFVNLGKKTKIKPAFLLINVLAWETTGENREYIVCKSCFLKMTRKDKQKIFDEFWTENIRAWKCRICDEKTKIFLELTNNRKYCCESCFVNGTLEDQNKDLNLIISKEEGKQISKLDYYRIMKLLFNWIDNSSIDINELYEEFTKALYEDGLYIFDTAFYEEEIDVLKLELNNKKINEELGFKTKIVLGEELNYK